MTQHRKGPKTTQGEVASNLAHIPVCYAFTKFVNQVVITVDPQHFKVAVQDETWVKAMNEEL